MRSSNDVDNRIYHKREIRAIKAKNSGVFSKHEKKLDPEVPAVKSPKFYPADHVKTHITNRRKPKTTKLR
ncbi:60S ribosomal protein L6 [Acorus calamus]|uniref:60S ribosomal protein L6 n=1 Tax=Acorus calamus TaxID=4465 RepID=A0AAV9ECM5_ACOCL|nr:60S ribosomal protein L6 [Acorus calamus]